MQSPLTGLELNPVYRNKRPVAVMIDGSQKAFPQAGLQDASMVFSADMEGLMTRFMAIYLDCAPNRVGPVRSTRSYFIDWAVAQQPFFVHCGGIPQAIERLLYEPAVIDIDYIYTFNKGQKQIPFTKLNFFERRSDRVAPHNLYLDLNLFRKRFNLKQLKAIKPEVALDSDGELMNFSSYESIPHGNNENGKGSVASSVEIVGSRKQRILYKFNDLEMKFNRFVGFDSHSSCCEPHLDENYSRVIGVDNLVVMWVDSERLPGDLTKRLLIKTLDKGKAMFFLKGRMIRGKWLKINYDMSIRFFNEKGERVSFEKGNIWIEVVSKQAKVKVKK
jgi:hypothetical protein